MGKGDSKTAKGKRADLQLRQRAFPHRAQGDGRLRRAGR